VCNKTYYTYEKTEKGGDLENRPETVCCEPDVVFRMKSGDPEPFSVKKKKPGKTEKKPFFNSRDLSSNSCLIMPWLF
jgi:hypothetical protein